VVFPIIYEDENLLVIDKPAGIVVFPENNEKESVIDYLIKERPELKKAGKAPRYGIIHRLDKETSGILLVAKNNSALEFFQKQFKERKVIKKYLALVFGKVKDEKGEIETLLGRNPKDKRKQKVYFPFEPGANRKRIAQTSFSVLERIGDFTLLEVCPKTGRKHQIRVHLSFLGHPIVGDKLYSFRKQKNIFERQFLHCFWLKIKMPNGKEKEFFSPLPKELKNFLEKIKNG